MSRYKESTSTDRILAHKYSSDFDIPLELAQIVAHRFPEYENAKAFLFPDLNRLHDPSTIPDIEAAVEKIIRSLNGKEKILIYCHDDPDGYTSAAIMHKTLKDLSRTHINSVFVYPIIREKDGYILNPEVLNEYKQKGVTLVITVDFGISSEDNFRNAKNEGLELIVCDHHEIHTTDFSAPAVDPKRPDSKYPFRELAGVGVTFKLAQLLYQRVFNLSPTEFYSLKKNFFALAMVGTISDRVMLLGENRVLCYYGLQVFNHLDDPWIKYHRKMPDFHAEHVIGDIIAVLGSAAYIDPSLAVEVMLCNDEKYVAKVIAKLKTANEERRQAVMLLYKEALAAAKNFPSMVISIIPFSRQHHLGSVSARLRARYKKTSMIIGIKSGKCFGELRSSDINLYKMLYHFRELFLDFGGHCRAAGFTMSQDNLDRLVDEVVKYTSKYVEKIPNEYGHTLELAPTFLDRSKVDILMPLAPFGEGNPAPVLTDGVTTYTINNQFNIIEKE